MKSKKIINKIEKITLELVKKGETLSRADLAYELKELGIDQDSSYISELVWNAYSQSTYKDAIKKAFTNNSGNRSLIDEYQLVATLEKGNPNKAINIVQEQAHETNLAIQELQDNINSIISTVTTNYSTTIAQRLTGTSGIQKVQSEAIHLFQRYSKLVNGYEKARCNVQEIASSYIELRADIEKVFNQYSMSLVDIFGDSITVIQPTLFDFNKIEWLDVQGMLSQIELQYTTITTRCTELIKEISDSFNQSIQSSINSYRVLNNKQMGLIIAGLNMLNHYMNASSKTNEIRAGLITIKNDLRHDVTNIKSDLFRLAKIFKQINDIFIPQATTFYRYADKILSEELNDILNVIYDNKEAKQLKEQRDELLERFKILEHYMNDERTNIIYYNDHIQECCTLLDSLKSQYDEAILLKPDKPSILANIFSFGNANKSYYRKIHSWSIDCLPLVKRYESLKVDIKLDQEDKIVQERLFNEHKKEYSEIKFKLSSLSQKMKLAIKVDNTTKKEIVNHLKDIVSLLNIAKNITENKLNDQDIKVTSIKDFGNLTIPYEVSKNIDVFTQLLKDNLKVDNESLKKIINKPQYRLPHDIEDNENSEFKSLEKENEGIIEETCNIANSTLSQAIETFNCWAKLQALQEQSSKSKLHYQNEMQQLKKRFEQELKGIDNKSEALREIIAKCNTSKDKETLKKGLMYLADINERLWEDEDWDLFLEDKKTLTL